MYNVLIMTYNYLDDYTTSCEPDDQMEWSLVLGEIRAFIEADTVVNILDSDSNTIVLRYYKYFGLF